jgi:hypothetical protein
MKILESKRSKIRIIVEFCGIPNGFSNLVPNLAFFYQECGDGRGVFDDALPFNFIRFPPFPSLLFAIVPGHG